MNRRAAALLALVVAFAASAVAACGVSSAGEGGDEPGSAAVDAAIPSHDGATADAAKDGTAAADAGVKETSTPSDGALPPPVPGADASVTAFDQTLICFGSGGTGPCSRTVDAQVTFPATGSYSAIAMHVTLDCPSNGCDPWDRVGSIALVTTPDGPDAGTEVLTELGRFITPYDIVSGVNSPPAWDIDVTELRPLLTGTVTLRAFIDTWVPQGNASAYGGGWVLGATFEMKGGIAPKDPVAVVPIWTWKTTGKEPTQIVYGDPTNPISSSLPTQNVQLPAGATSYGIRSTITGHGQANLDNCAEFCSEQHTWQVGSSPNQEAMWRTDCASFPSSGTYQYSRAGWCPGADVIPWDIDVTSQVGTGATVPISYAVTPYANTCNGTTCSGCASGESCTYDGSDHTQPFYYVQALLIGFR